MLELFNNVIVGAFSGGVFYGLIHADIRALKRDVTELRVVVFKIGK